MNPESRAGLVPGEPVEVLPGVVRLLAPNASLMTGPGTNTYLVGGADVAVIDPGPDDPAHLERICELAGERVRFVVVTHSHRDHAPGATALSRRTGATLLGFDERPTYRPDGKLAEGDVVVTDHWRLEALHTPGHSSDHLCFVGDAISGSAPRIVFSGDHIMEGSTVVIGPPDGDMSEYLRSLERFAALGPPVEVIAPGHGHLIGDPTATINAYLERRRQREASVLAALGLGAARAGDLVPLVYNNLPDGLVRHAGRSVWAHLRKLGQEGWATTSDPDDPDARWEVVRR